MADEATAFMDFVAERAPFALLPADTQAETAAYITRANFPAGKRVYAVGDKVDDLLFLAEGSVTISDPQGVVLSKLHPGDVFGERALLRDGLAPVDAVADTDIVVYLLQRNIFAQLMTEHDAFARFFDRAGGRASAEPSSANRLMNTRIADLMETDPPTVPMGATVRDAAIMMRDLDVSCLPVVDGERLVGLVTGGDMADRVIAEALGPETPVTQAMTPEPMALEPRALGFDALLTMTVRGFDHFPVVEGGRLVGLVTSAALVRREAVSAAFLVSDIAKRERYDDFAEIVGRIPKLLAQLVGSGVGPYDVGRIVTSVADALTRRLLTLGEAKLGPAPVPWVWAACGSQGRREQTGVSDQDNCLILGDEFEEVAHRDYFTALARFVCDGLDAAGYFNCPGDMMATNLRWCQPLSVWRRSFNKWIAQPDNEAQMLASVMFDLRPIAGDTALIEGLREATLAKARGNSIFRAHMVGNSLKHQPPLGLFRGFATIRSGENKDKIDMKHAGVVPVVDLGRVYALMGGLTPVNTRDRVEAALSAGVVSPSGGRDLLDAFDLIAETRLEHQARLIREGRKPDNFLSPGHLSELERNHLKDAFVVVKTMQSAAANSHGMGG
jgi:CBS domain-containing protein